MEQYKTEVISDEDSLEEESGFETSDSEDEKTQIRDDPRKPANVLDYLGLSQIQTQIIFDIFKRRDKQRAKSDPSKEN